MTKEEFEAEVRKIETDIKSLRERMRERTHSEHPHGQYCLHDFDGEYITSWDKYQPPPFLQVLPNQNASLCYVLYRVTSNGIVEDRAELPPGPLLYVINEHVAAWLKARHKRAGY